MIMLLPFICAENTTTTDSYSYDYIANGTSIKILDQIDSDDKTSIIFEFNSTPGEYEISGVLGIVTTEIKFIGDETNTKTIDFEKVLPGTKKFLLMVYKEDSLIAFITNNELNVTNNMTLDVSGDSSIQLDAKIYISLITDTNLNIEDSKLKIISSKGTIYENVNMTIGNNNKITYIFTPAENAEYNLYELNINDYIREINGSLGTYDFALIKSFSEEKTEDGLKISFVSTCDCEKEITVTSNLDEFVYNSTIDTDSFIIPGKVINESEINGPYKIIIATSGINYEYVTQEYNYNEFVTIEETESTTGSSGTTNIEIVNETTEEITTTENETVDIIETETIIEETEKSEITTEETTKTNNVSVKEKISNLLTGFSISDITNSFKNGKKTITIAGITLLVIAILTIIYVRQRKDAYLYEM